MCRHLPRLLLLALATGAFWLTAVPHGARAGDEKDAHLRYRKTYGDALLESRIRNVPVLVTRHKDD
jgi:hypothetical protein